MKNYGMDYESVKDRFEILSVVPESKSPVNIFYEIEGILSSKKPSILIIDSLTALEHHMNPKELSKFIRYLQLYSKERKITIMVTLNYSAVLSDMASIPRTNVSTLSDTIILLSNKIKDSSLKRELLILKSRASDHSRKVFEYEITDKGVEIRDL